MKGWSQSDLARHAGIAQSQISDIETGKVIEPGGVNLGRLAKGLETTIADLLPFEDNADIRSRMIAQDLADRYDFGILLEALRFSKGSAATNGDPSKIPEPRGANDSGEADRGGAARPGESKSQSSAG